ncbi:S8 family serine peptidase [Catalinimonas alkaloidigena]|nr:S8 family serine peptidase [Catalinimonas alkaloidigena]
MQRRSQLWLFLLLPFWAASLPLTAQPHSDTEKYWIFLTDKDLAATPAISAQTRANRQHQGLPLFQWTDVPLQAAYVQALQHEGVQIVCRSRWLNAVSAYLTDAQQTALRQLPFVKEVRPLRGQLQLAETEPTETTRWASPASQQMASPFFETEKLTGKGVVVGVIDAGFYRAHQSPTLRHLFEAGQILQFRDFVNPTKADFFGTSETAQDAHGTSVLNMITGWDEEKHERYGFAPDAQFYLARTDHGNDEFRGEEDYWMAAMEWMDSLGVRLINTSLGYALGFDNPQENYRPEEMDGQTSTIVKAARIATEEKGILLVVSAGNDGDNRHWRYISTPADAPGVLAVGATWQDVWKKMGYSGIGPAFLPYLKPDVACYSLTGTSFSAPVITGFVACLMQKAPHLTNAQLMELVRRSAHLYPYGNNYVGYGVPQADRALQWLAKTPPSASAREVRVKGDHYHLKLRHAHENEVLLFHKRDATQVVDQTTARVRRHALDIARPDGVARTTIDLQTEVIELVWE